MFRVGSELPESYMNGILQALVPLLQELPNALSLTGHTDSLPYAGGDGGYSNWELSAGRANAARRVLVRAALTMNASYARDWHRQPNAAGEHIPGQCGEPPHQHFVLSRSKSREIRLEDTQAQRADRRAERYQSAKCAGLYRWT